MKVISVGGGPGGLFTAILLRARGIADEVTVYERNGPDDTFGFGVVFSDETLDNINHADPISLDEVARSFRHWGDIDIAYRGRWINSKGHGFAAISRLRLLQILARRAQDVGVEVHFNSEVDPAELPDADLILAADGANSRMRSEFEEGFQPSIEWGKSHYAWFGTTKVFESFTFIFEETEQGLFQAHCYPYSDDMSTLIVETSEEAWRKAGLDYEVDLAPGETDEVALEFTEGLFAKYLDGNGLVGNNSKWLQFPRITNHSWVHDNIVLIGDAAHTAHFSIGSGTKLALEDAIALADAMAEQGSVAHALVEYEQARKPVVESLQRAAYTSREWFEEVERYVGLDDEQFAFQLLTRSQRITYDNLQMRDPALVDTCTTWFRDQQPPELRPADESAPPMFYPLQVGGLTLPNRVGVSPMAQYCAAEGVPTEWHLVHLGSRAVGGAGLVMTEMTCVSPEGRITPGCTGLWNGRQQDAWADIVEFIHQHSNAAVGIQLGHSGRKGSTMVPWEAGDTDDTPLAEGNWELLAPSPLPWHVQSQVPREMSAADLDEVLTQFVESTRRAAEAGFDLLELHMAHGYLLSSFLSPLSNQRSDHYGGALENRARYPLEVFDAVRAVWPEDRPISVRISATDWYEGGNTADEAVAFARLFKDAGCDILDVSTGQTHPGQTPRYGRLYQTPFSDRIRQEVGIKTMTVGAVSSVDDINTILVAGRADLCLMARAHLVDPYWTLNAAIDQRYQGHPWPEQYLSGKRARRRDQDAVVRIDDPT